MASQEQQPQEERQQPTEAEAPTAPVATANPEVPASSTKSFLAVRREALRANVASSGKRIVCAQAMSLVTTTVLGMLCWWAFWQTESTCTGGQVGLRSWYLGAFVLAFMLLALFLCMIYSVLAVWSNQVVADRSVGEVHGNEVDCGVGLGFVLIVLAFLAVVWSTLGLLSRREEDVCESGSEYFWVIFTVMWVSICCCAGGNAADMYRRRCEVQERPASATQEIIV